MYEKVKIMATWRRLQVNSQNCGYGFGYGSAKVSIYVYISASGSGIANMEKLEYICRTVYTNEITWWHVITWKHFPHYWPLRSYTRPVMWALVLLAQTINNEVAGDSRRHGPAY